MTGPDPFGRTDGPNDSLTRSLVEGEAWLTTDDRPRPLDRPRAAYVGDSGTGPGRILALLLLIAVAFGGGIAVDQAAFREQGAAPFGTQAPLPSNGVRPPTTPRPGTTAAPAGSPRSTTGGTGASATAAGTPGATIGPGATVAPYAPANVGLLWEAIQVISEHFVRRGALNPTDLTYGLLNGLVDSLGDPGHTVFLTPDEVASDNDSLNGHVTGIGVYLGLEGGQPVIQSVISGSPAAAAGLLSGDALIAIDGANVENLSIEAISKLVRGAEGTQISLTLIHPHGSTPVTVTITRAKITVPAVTWVMLPGTQVADIRINEFSANTNQQFTSALRAARQAGAHGIVLDLRDNPGGYVDEAVGVSSQFLSKGVVYNRRTADGEQIPVAVRPGGIAVDLPLIVLVNYGTASSAEITAGALQSAKRGTVIGTRTYGTGTVLNTFSLSDGSAIRLGVEEWLTPDGTAIFPSGIQPDVAVNLADDTRPLEPDTLRSMTGDDLQASGDTQLLRAMQDLAGR